jgi:hypothetical protein
MPGGGSKKGERRGGRQKGSLNRATIERLEQAKIIQQIEDQACHLGASDTQVGAPTTSKRKLAREELEDLLPIIKGGVAHFQPTPAGALAQGVPENKDGDWPTFKSWLQFYADTLLRLAEFQSPRFKAIAVAMGTTPTAPPQPGDGAKVISLDDPVALQRIYERRIRSVR